MEGEKQGGRRAKSPMRPGKVERGSGSSRVCVSLGTKTGEHSKTLGTRTRSRFILSIALSIPFTTVPMLFVTVRIVTAVCTRLATASIRDDSRRRLSPSVFLRMAFWA